MPVPAFLRVLAPVLGNITSVTMLVSPVFAVARMRRRGSLGSVNPVPYPLTVINTTSWIIYAVVKSDPFIFPAPCVGLAAGIWMTLSAYGLASRKVQDRIICILMAGAAVFVTGGMVSSLVLSKSPRPAAEAATADGSGSKLPRDDRDAAVASLWGCVAVAVLLVYYSSPLSTIYGILTSRDASSIYLPLSIAAIANGALWTTYGLAKGDPFMFGPNAAGAALGVLQVVLRLVLGAGGSSRSSCTRSALTAATEAPAVAAEGRAKAAAASAAAAAGVIGAEAAPITAFADYDDDNYGCGEGVCSKTLPPLLPIFNIQHAAALDKPSALVSNGGGGGGGGGGSSGLGSAPYSTANDAASAAATGTKGEADAVTIVAVNCASGSSGDLLLPDAAAADATLPLRIVNGHYPISSGLPASADDMTLPQAQLSSAAAVPSAAFVNSEDGPGISGCSICVATSASTSVAQQHLPQSPLSSVSLDFNSITGRSPAAGGAPTAQQWCASLLEPPPPLPLSASVFSPAATVCASAGAAAAAAVLLPPTHWSTSQLGVNIGSVADDTVVSTAAGAAPRAVGSSDVWAAAALYASPLAAAVPPALASMTSVAGLPFAQQQQQQQQLLSLCTCAAGGGYVAPPLVMSPLPAAACPAATTTAAAAAVAISADVTPGF